MPYPKTIFYVAGLLLLSFPACYEEIEGCTDPDATNYDLTADASCVDCCTYPSLRLEVLPTWNDTTFQIDSVYRDAAGNAILLNRFRLYLAELRVGTAGEDLPVPVNIQELAVALNGDTVLLDVNVNAYLINTAAPEEATVGTLAFGERDVNSISGTFGLGPELQAAVPARNSGSILATQPNLLNFNDGRGYAQARLEYTLPENSTDSLRSVSLYGLADFQFAIPDPALRRRFTDVTVVMEIKLADLIAGVDLAADSATVATGLSANLPNSLIATGTR